jgi:hypothetical protein
MFGCELLPYWCFSSFPDPLHWTLASILIMADVIVDLELDATMVFDHDEWIGQGKIFKNVPPYVCRTLVDAQRLLQILLSRFPHPDLPVLKFLDVKLPTVSAQMVAIDATACFSTHPPQTDIIALLSRSIPPQSFLRDLDDDLHLLKMMQQNQVKFREAKQFRKRKQDEEE